MSYTPINWQNGDIITAEKLNKMDRGWDTSYTTLFTETVTTVADGGFNSEYLTYAFAENPPETLTITFDGTDYECQKTEPGYGEFDQDGPDFTNYPFFLMIVVNGYCRLFTETAGTYTISAKTSSVVCSDEFEKAVKTAAGGFLVVHEVDGTLDKTWQEIHDAIILNPVVIVFERDDGVLANYVYQASIRQSASDNYVILTIFEDLYATDSVDGYPSISVEEDEQDVT